MDEYRNDEIIYEEDWQRVDTPITANDAGDTDTRTKRNIELKKPKTKRGFPRLITIQLVICLLIAFCVFILKAMNSDTYKNLCAWYEDMMSETLISNSTFEQIDLSEYLKATADEI